MAKLPAHLQPVVETICAQGCESVTQVIKQLEQKQPVEATAKLDQNDREQILHELQSIMAVYELSDKSAK